MVGASLKRTITVESRGGIIPLDRFALRAITIQDTDTSERLLEQFGWQIDADAVETLAALNPSTDIYHLEPGQIVQVPWQDDKGEPKRFIVDDREKSALANMLRRGFARWWEDVNFDISLVAPNLEKTCQQIANEQREIAERLEKRLLVTTSSSLAVLRAEAIRFDQSMTLFRSMQPADREKTLLALALNLHAQFATLSSERRTLHGPRGSTDALDYAHVKITTWKQIAGQDPQPVRGYRIWYALMFDIGRADAAIRLGALSPVDDESLPPATYVFWATDSDRSEPRLGTVESVTVLPDQTKPLDLVVNETGGPPISSSP